MGEYDALVRQSDGDSLPDALPRARHEGYVSFKPGHAKTPPDYRARHDDAGNMPIILGGDDSIRYPLARGIAEWVDGYVGNIHLDRHVDTPIEGHGRDYA